MRIEAQTTLKLIQTPSPKEFVDDKQQKLEMLERQVEQLRANVKMVAKENLQMEELLMRNNEKIQQLSKQHSDNKNLIAQKLSKSTEENQEISIKQLRGRLAELKEQKSKLVNEKIDKEKKFRETSSCLQAKLANLENKFSQYVKFQFTEKSDF